MSPEEIQATVGTFLDKLGVTVEEVVVTTGHRTIVSIKTPDATLLIGPDGEHLRAFNSLAHRFVEKKYGEGVNFLVDVNGYHEERMEKVRQEARMHAQKVRLFKRDVALEPMSAYERLVVHELFADDPQIQTVSEGVGVSRHIVLKSK